jgi:hypothetical protein
MLLAKTLQNCLMETLTDAVGLRMIGFGFGVFNVIEGK